MEVMVEKYFWGTIQAHQIMENLLLDKLHQHLDVAPHITICLFEHCYPWVYFLVLKNSVEDQSRTIIDI